MKKKKKRRRFEEAGGKGAAGSPYCPLNTCNGPLKSPKQGASVSHSIRLVPKFTKRIILDVVFIYNWVVHVHTIKIIGSPHIIYICMNMS